MEDSDEITQHRNDWRLLLALFLLAGIVESQSFGHLGAFTPLFLGELRVPASQVGTWTGILSALGFVIGLPLLPFWGVWAEKYSRKLVIVRSAYVEALILTLAGLSPNVWVLALARFLGGFVLGNTGVMLALLADVTPRKRLGLAVGLASAGFPIGSSVGPYLGGLITQHYGVRTLLMVDGVASLAIGLLLTLTVRDEPRIAQVARSAGVMIRQAASDIVTSPVVSRLFILYFLAMFGGALAQPFVPLLLTKLYLAAPGAHADLVPTMIGTSLTIAGVAMAIATPIWGRLGDLIGRWRILPVCLAMVTVYLAVASVASTLLTVQAAIVVNGLFLSGVPTTILALLATLTPRDRRASVLNFSLLPSQLSWFLGPFVGAGLVAFGLRVPFMVGAVFAAGACGVAVVLARRLGATSAEASAAEDEAVATAGEAARSA
jgi:MFS transporter, DHA1 family, multidrug resistance protein